MSLGTTFSEAGDILRRNVFALLVIGGLVFIPLDLVTALIDDERGWGDASWTAVALFTVVWAVGGSFAYAAAIEAIAVEPEGATEEARTPFAALRDAARRWPTVLAITAAASVGVLAGLVLLVVPGIVLITWWLLAYQPALVERLGWRESLGRSRELVRGSFWQVLVVAIVACGGSVLVDYAIFRIGEASLPNFVAAWVGGAVADTLTIALSAALTTAAYWQLRSADGASLQES
jgi:hypothetical protein